MASMGGGRDHQAFPEFYAEYNAASGLAKRLGNRVVVNGPIKYSNQQVLRDIQNLKAGLAKAKGRAPGVGRFPARRCAGERAPRRQERALQE